MPRKMFPPCSPIGRSVQQKPASRATVPRLHANAGRRSGALAGLLRRSSGRATGARSAHDWRLAQHGCSARSLCPRLRVQRWLPSSSSQEHQVALKAAVMGVPEQIGGLLANRTSRGAASAEFRVETAQEVATQGPRKKAPGIPSPIHHADRRSCQSRAKHWFVDEARCRATVDLRGKWLQRGQPALLDSTGPWLEVDHLLSSHLLRDPRVDSPRAG